MLHKYLTDWDVMVFDIAIGIQITATPVFLFWIRVLSIAQAAPTYHAIICTMDLSTYY